MLKVGLTFFCLIFALPGYISEASFTMLIMKVTKISSLDQSELGSF